MFPPKVSCMFPATENPKDLFFLWVIINILKCTPAHIPATCKGASCCSRTEFQKRSEQKAELTGGTDETTDKSSGKDHTDAQWNTTTTLLFDDCSTQLSMCSRTRLALTHTKDGSATDAGNMIWATHFPGHVFPTITKTNHFSPRNVARQITSNQSNSSLVTVCTSQATEHEGPGFPLQTTRQLVNTGHTRTFHCNWADSCPKPTRSDLDLGVQTL